MNQTAKADLGEILNQTRYTRERLSPRPGDMYYPHLVDLLRVLKQFSTVESIKLLDYGCGGSPYKELFPNATYHRADFVPVPGLDFQVDQFGRLDGVTTGTYDIVVSTQVLEHIIQPEIYLSECFRVLKANGILILTTHGFFEEHGCPYDFHRWTADGLRVEVKNCGFEIDEVKKMTVGARAAAQLLPDIIQLLARCKNNLLGLLFSAANWFLKSHLEKFHIWLDQNFKHEEEANLNDINQTYYIGLMVIGRKVETTRP